MADTTFSNGTVIEPDWLNDVNDVVYFDASDNYVTGTLGWQNQLILYPENFGGVAGGVTDATQALQDALAQAVVMNAVVDGRGLTYKVTGTLSLHAGCTLRNIILDASTGGNSLVVLSGTGTMSASTSVTSGSTANSMTVNVASTSGLAVDDYVYLGCSDYWDDWDDFCFAGEVHRIKSIGVGTVTFYEPILYTVSTTVTLAKINTLNNITLDRVKAIGSNTGATGDQEGASFSYCKDLVLLNCDFQGFDDRCVRLTRCINTSVQGGIYGRANKTGLSYGIALGDACYYTHIVGTHFVDCRHGVTHGNTEGVNRYTTVIGCTFDGMREAAIDTHTSADHVIFSSNVISGDPTNTVCDGILIRSLNSTITNNRILNPGRHGIHCLGHLTLSGTTGTVTIKGNTIETVAGLYGIYIRNRKAPGTHNKIIVEGNIITGSGQASSIGVFVQNELGAIKTISIHNNTLRNFRRTIYCYCDGTTTISSDVITNNTFEMAASGTEAVYVNAGTDGNHQNIVITGNNIVGAVTTGIRGNNEENIVITGNNLRAATTKVSITATNNVNANNLT